MNSHCPVCEKDLTIVFNTTPYEENDKLFTLQFCSPGCRDTYKRNNE